MLYIATSHTLLSVIWYYFILITSQPAWYSCGQKLIYFRSCLQIILQRLSLRWYRVYEVAPPHQMKIYNVAIIFLLRVWLWFGLMSQWEYKKTPLLQYGWIQCIDRQTDAMIRLLLKTVTFDNFIFVYQIWFFRIIFATFYALLWV